MICQRCAFDNPSGFAFCGKCGAPLAAAGDRLTLADLDHLRAYLPSPLVEELHFDLDAPSDSLVGRCNEHLVRLLDTTATYLPGFIVDHITRDPTPGRAGGAFTQGSLLFADISGFTAMSERLSRIGREGAEEITSLVNRYFGAMLSIMKAHDGHLVKFGGDALLCLFSEPGSATRAVQAAAGMQAAMADFAETRTSQGVFPLRMKIGIRKGRFFSAQLGTSQNMEHALFGGDVNATAAAEAGALAGQVLADADTLRAVDVERRATPVGDDGRYFAVDKVRAASGVDRTPALAAFDAQTSLASLRRAVKLLDALTPYLPAGLLARLASGPHLLSLEGEHRLVAVLFAKVDGLSALVDRMGPGREQDIVAALNQYFVAMSNAVHRMGGVINKFDLAEQGDKLLAFFGAPLAHEDDAERAVRAALSMQATLADVSASIAEQTGLPELRLGQRVGINYGFVFAGYVGTSWRREYTVMGDEVNLAARLMDVADAGGVAVSRSVQRKVRALFELAPRGEVRLKGKSEPAALFAVSGPRARPEPLRGLEGMHSPLVGREAEWAQLLSTLEQLRLGKGQIVSVTGEAGLGKSRLVAELREQVERQDYPAGQPGVRWLEGRCLSYTESVSYRPVQELLRQLAGIRSDAGDREAWRALRDAVSQGLPPDETDNVLPFLTDFLGVPLDEASRDKIRYLDAEALQRRTFLAIRRLIESQAAAAPLVIALDDIHWLDRASLHLLEHLMPLVDAAPLMLLLMYRPERSKGCWQIHEKAAREFAHCTTEIALRHLTPAEVQQLLGNLVRVSQWPPSVEMLILSRIEGNPLYLEEVLRALIDNRLLTRSASGAWHIAGEVDTLQVPDTLQGVMMARLDRLEEPPRRSAQVASVVGRLFPYDVLTHVAEEDESTLHANLTRLQQNEIVREDQRTPDLVYAFQHGMMQEVCYGSLLKRTRRDYHRRIAAYLESTRSDGDGGVEADVALLAHHAFAGQDWERALEYQLRAGRRAQRLFANHEAIDHFGKALQSADNLPASDTAAQRLEIHISLGELLTTTGQYEPALAHLQQAQALADARDERDAQARACRWLARLHELRGEFSPALEWIDRGLAVLAGRETAEAAEMRINAGLIHSRQGDYDGALEQCQEALRVAQKLDALPVLARAYNLLGHVTRLLGQSAMAINDFRTALDLFVRSGDIHGQAMLQNQLANAYFDIGQWREADRNYRQSREAFNLLGDAYNRAFAENNLGGIALNQGRLDDALAFYESALNALERIGGSEYVIGVLHNNLGATFIRRGDAAAARDHLRTSHSHFEKAQSRDFLPELYRHFAEAALLSDDLAEAEARGQEALRQSRELSMRAEEGYSLRVLGELRLQQGQLEQAESLLRQSLSILEDIRDEYESARSRLSLARVQLAQGTHREALAAVDQCAPVFERLDAGMELAAARDLRDAAIRAP